jgi:hypothetical protein
MYSKLFEVFEYGFLIINFFSFLEITISNPFAYFIVFSWRRAVLFIFFETSFLHEATKNKNENNTRKMID